MIIKIGYAFLYQEIYVSVPFLYNPITMNIGAYLMPLINGLASRISGFPQTDQNVVDAKGLYPGDNICRAYSPHAVWHEEAGNGFLEMMFLADTIYGVLGKAIEERDSLIE